MNKPILLTSPKKSEKKSVVVSSGKKGVKFADEEQETKIGGIVSEFDNKKSQICLGEYQSLCEEFHNIVENIQEVIKNQQMKVQRQQEESENIVSDYAEAREHETIRYQNLQKEIKKRDGVILQLKKVVEDYKNALEETKKLYQETVKHYQNNMQKMMESDIEKQDLYNGITKSAQSSSKVFKSILKENSNNIKEAVIKYSTLHQEYQQLKVENEQKIQQKEGLQNELERAYSQLDEEIQQRSQFMFQLERLIEYIKEIWSIECESLAKTKLLGQRSTEQPIDLLKDIQEQIKQLKTMNELQKDECYSLLQQISDQNEYSCLVSQEGSERNNDFSPYTNHRNPTPQRRSSIQQLNKTQSKRNELYNMLREEIKRMQVEINGKKDTIIQIKKYCDNNEKAYRQKCDEVDYLIKDNQELLYMKNDMSNQLEFYQRNNQDLLEQLENKENAFIEQKQQIDQFEKELGNIQHQFEKIFKENILINQEKSELQNECERCVYEIEELKRENLKLIEQRESHMGGLKEKVKKLKEKISQKENVIYEVRLNLEQEMREKNQIQSEIEEKVLKRKSVGINTDDSLYNIEQENLEMRQELVQVKHDINVLLESYDQVRKDNERLVDKINELEEDIARIELEKFQVEKVLEQERAFLNRVKNVETQFNQMLEQNSNNNIFIQQSKKHSRSQGKHKIPQNQLNTMILQDNSRLQYLQNQVDSKNSRSQPKLGIYEPQMLQNDVSQTTSCTPCQNYFQSLPNRSTSKKSQQKMQYYSNLGGGLSVKHQHSTLDQTLNNNTIFQYQPSLQIHSDENMKTNETDKENNNISDGSSSINQKDGVLQQRKVINQIIKKKMKKRMKHFETVLSYLIGQIEGRTNPNQSLKSPLILKRSSSSHQVKSTTHTQMNTQQSEDAHFYQAQSYFYYKYPPVYNILQRIVNESLKKRQERVDSLRWQLTTTSRKLTAICLDGAIMLNNERFTEDLQQAREFLQQDITQIFEQEAQLQQINEKMFEGISHLIYQSCSIVLSKSSLATDQNQSTSFIGSSISPSHRGGGGNKSNGQIIIDNNQQMILEIRQIEKLLYLESSLKEKLELISQLNQKMQLKGQVIENLNKIDKVENQEEYYEYVWRVLCLISKFIQCFKLELNYDLLSLNQINKNIPKQIMQSFEEQNKEKSGVNANNDNFIKILRDIEKVKPNKQNKRMSHQVEKSSHNKLEKKMQSDRELIDILKEIMSKYDNQ